MIRRRATILRFSLLALMTFSHQAWAQDDSATTSEPAAAPAPETSETTPAVQEAAAPTATNTSSGGLLGDFRVGPSVNVGFPFLMNYGVDVMWKKTFSGGFYGGGMKRDIDDKSQIELYNWDLRGRWHPFQGSFFLGAAYGKHGIVGLTKSNLKFDNEGVEMTVPTSLRLEITSSYLTPHLGWMSVWDSGFTMGFEIGYQIPSGVSTEMQTAFENVSASGEQAVKDSAAYKKLKTDLEDLGDTLGKTAVPYINLLKLGWMF